MHVGQDAVKLGLLIAASVGLGAVLAMLFGPLPDHWALAGFLILLSVGVVSGWRRRRRD